MDSFRQYLQQEFMRRSAKNSRYSLRSFAAQLGIHHATLSSILNGKRKLTSKALAKIAEPLGLGPADLNAMMDLQASTKTQLPLTYQLLQQDAFAALSDWSFDAILELSRVTPLSPESVAEALDIPPLQAAHALETLERLELLTRGPKGQYKLTFLNSTDILDPNFTSAAKRKYQRSVLEKSLAALDGIDPKERDHTSTTMAINTADLPKVRELITVFRRHLDQYLQRAKANPNEVYQLQVSFFPLSRMAKLKSKRGKK